MFEHQCDFSQCLLLKIIFCERTLKRQDSVSFVSTVVGFKMAIDLLVGQCFYGRKGRWMNWSHQLRQGPSL